MLLQISTLIILGCFFPAVLSRPSVSLQNDGYGHYDFQYDVSHPKGSSRGHMRFGSTSNKHARPHIPDQHAQKDQADKYAAHSPLSSAHNPDSYRTEEQGRRHDYANSHNEPEIFHEPRPIYPSPYDSNERQLGNHNGAHDETYNSPVSKVNRQAPLHSASIPEAAYYPPQPIHDTNDPGHAIEQHPNSFVSSNPVISQEPISQVSAPAFSEPHEGYDSNQGDSLNVQPVPVGSKYQFIPSGPPYIVDSHSTEIIHAPHSKGQVVVQQPVDIAPHLQEPISYEPDVSPLPQAPIVVQQPVDIAPLPQEHISYEPDVSPLPQAPVVVQQSVDIDPHPQEPISYHPDVSYLPQVPVVQQSVDIDPHPQEPISYQPNVSPLPNSKGVKQPVLSQAFQLPVAPLPYQSPILSGPKVEDIQQANHEVLTPPGIPILVKEPVDLSLHSDSPISHDSTLTPLSDVHPPPVSHAFRLPLLPITPEHSPIPSGPSVDADQSLAHIGQSAGITHVDPISHSTRLLIPGSAVPGAPKALSDSLLPLGHDSVNLGHPNINNGPVGFSEIDSSVDSHALPPISHAFRLSLPQAVSNQHAPSISELKPVETAVGPSPFSEVESPDAPQLPQLSHAFRLNLPLGPTHGRVAKEPKVDYFPRNEASKSLSDTPLLALETKV